MRTTTDEARDSALSIASVRSAHFFQSNLGYVAGVVYDGSTGIEFDVREVEESGWIVNDDHGRNHVATSLPEAIRKAINANA